MYGDVVLGLKGSKSPFEPLLARQEEEARRQARHRSARRRPQGTGGRVQDGAEEAAARRLPGGPAAAALGRDRGGVALVDGRPRGVVPAHQSRPGDARHRRQRDGDGLRQLRRGLRHGRRVHARPLHRRAGASSASSSSTRRARTWWRASGRRSTSRRWRSASRRRTSSCSKRISGWRSTTGTCRTSSSRSSAASSTCFRPGTASAPRRRAVRIAVDMVDEGLITEEDALMRVSPTRSTSCCTPWSIRRRTARPGEGPAGLAWRGGRPGGVRRARGVRLGEGREGRHPWSGETSPEDIEGMNAAKGSSPRAAG